MLLPPKSNPAPFVIFGVPWNAKNYCCCNMNKFCCKFLFAIARNMFLHASNSRHHRNTYILRRAYLKNK